MHWIAPTELDNQNAVLEKRLGAAAEQALPAAQCVEAGFKSPRPDGLLSLIFLRFPEVRFASQRARLELPSTSGRGAEGEAAARLPRRDSRVDDPAAYPAKGSPYLPAQARFDPVLKRPESALPFAP